MDRELVILNAISEALNRSVDLDQSLHTTLAKVAELLDLKTGWVFLLDEDSGEPYLAAAQNLPPGLASDPRRMEGVCYCLRTYQAGDLRGAANVNVVTCSRLGGLVDGTGGLRFHASIPLHAQGKRLGLLNVASADWRELSREELRLLYTVGDLLSIAVERARLFVRSVLLGAAEERNRLARELHDTIAQGLAAIALQLETVDALLDAGAEPERVGQSVRQALALTRANLDEARRSVLDLRAAPLDGRTRSDALTGLAAEMTAGGDLDVTFEAAGGARPLPARVEVGLYRIAQEALTNAARHARARRASVRLEMAPDRIRLEVQDDGTGFEPSQVSGDRFGLIGIRERARLLDGSLQLDTAPGAGTRLDVVVPFMGGQAGGRAGGP